jgi:hypothetical protein
VRQRTEANAIQEFNDPAYGFAVRFPAAWQARPGGSAASLVFAPR